MKATGLLITIAAATLGMVLAYPTGAPQETCEIFTANHENHKPQASRSNYELRVSSSSVSQGGIITVTLQGVGGEKFKGFFIQAQDQSTGEPVGKFIVLSDSQTRDCSGPGSENAVTHINANEKNKVTVQWQAPSGNSEVIRFRSVVVKNYQTFWNNVVSNMITVA